MTTYEIATTTVTLPSSNVKSFLNQRARTDEKVTVYYILLTLPSGGCYEQEGYYLSYEGAFQEILKLRQA